MSSDTKYSKYLTINIENHNDEIEYNLIDINSDTSSETNPEDKKICNLCGSFTKKMYFSYLPENLKTKTCFLCNIVTNFKKTSLGKCYLVASDLSQVNINQITLEKFNTSKEIPSANEIDPNSKIIKCISIYQFINTYSIMSNEDKIFFQNFKIMYTNSVTNNLETKTFDYFNFEKENIKTNNNNGKYNTSFFKIPEYKLTDSQHNLLSKYENNFKQESLKIIKNISDSINKKNLEVINKHNMILKLKNKKLFK